MKLSEITGMMSRVVSVGSHLHTATDFLGMFLGKKPSPDAHATVKGLYGIFGFADERSFEVLLSLLSSQEEKRDARFVIANFLSWLFPEGDLIDQLLAKYYGNAFRVFVTQMGSSEKHALGTVEVTETTPGKSGKTTTTTTKTEPRDDGRNNALEFLGFIYDTVKTSSSPEEGYKKVLGYMKAMNIPHIPDGLADKLREMWEKLPVSERQKAIAFLQGKYEDVVTGLGNHATALEEKNEERRGTRIWPF